MTKKLGTHNSKIMALKSQVLGKYVIARAWEYANSNDYKVRHVSLVDNPVMVSRSAKTARKLLDLIPEHVRELVADEETELHRALRDLDRAIASGDRYVDYHRSQIKRSEERLHMLKALLAHPIDIVEVTSTTTVIESVVP